MRTGTTLRAGVAGEEQLCRAESERLPVEFLCPCCQAV